MKLHWNSNQIAKNVKTLIIIKFVVVEKKFFKVKIFLIFNKSMKIYVEIKKTLDRWKKKVNNLTMRVQ